MSNVHVSYHFDGILEPLQESIKKYVNLNLYANPDVEQPLLKPYFKKIFTNKPEAQLDVSVHVSKNKIDRFEGTFIFTVDGNATRYSREGSGSFKNPTDLVNHAFAHFKHEITGEK
ncbi:MAG: hypothetical protein WCJ81_02075 [bacterium]